MSFLLIFLLMTCRRNNILFDGRCSLSSHFFSHFLFLDNISSAVCVFFFISFFICLSPLYLFSPSLQITFSQIDSTVLNALPLDLRREVVSQLETRQKQPKNSCTFSPTRSVEVVKSSIVDRRTKNPLTRERGGRGGGVWKEGRGRVFDGGGVREGFDLAVGDASTKVQQVRRFSSE